MSKFQVLGSLASLQDAIAAVVDTDGNNFKIEVSEPNLRISLMRASKGALVEITGQIVMQSKAMMGMAVHLPKFKATQVNVINQKPSQDIDDFLLS